MEILRVHFILQRLIQLIPVVFGISIVSFLIIHLIPGDPASIMLGSRATPENVQQLTAQMGLDKPLYDQYLIFLQNLVQGDLGKSILLKQSVNTLISERLGTTFFLVMYASVLSLLVSIPIALWSAMKKDSLLDNGFRTLSIFGLAMPSFWIGILLMLLFSIKIKLFPVSGYGKNFIGHLYYLFLPALTITCSLAPVLVRPLRSKIINVFSSEYIEAARARGLKEHKIILNHVLRNAISGTVTILGVNIGWLLGGSIVIETIFSVPGLGQLLINSILSRDYPIIQGLVLVFAILVIVVNLLTDLCYAWLDPRVDLE
ncbi:MULTISPECIES: ABC transporter permease [Brevibacillus]|jgi:peptide/nickel transport system permease protein|uniref:ABC transporter permease n=1 Tax=Brevibacillus TaxID=55080 RepID=UPI00286A62E4|nr:MULTISPECIES: ABC transporter permease [Brevibacillus]MED1954075.1 ABC transporter permease [Brevibacillus centrosporus]